MNTKIDITHGPLLFQVGAKVRPPEQSYIELEECECCGAAIGPCTDWPWHYDEEDCRAIRKPTEDGR